MNYLPVELTNMIYEYHNPHRDDYNKVVKSLNERRQIQARYKLCLFELDFHISETWYYEQPIYKRVFYHSRAHKEEYEDVDDHYQMWIEDYYQHIYETTDSDDDFQEFIKDLDYEHYIPIEY